LGVACRSRAPAPRCPPPDTLEALHAATFHFEHGSPDAGRAALARVRSLDGELDGVGRDVVARLAEIDRFIDADPDRAQREVESLRMALVDRRCLTKALHDRFHASLPPR
jgi:hypothetical protein